MIEFSQSSRRMILLAALMLPYLTACCARSGAIDGGLVVPVDKPEMTGETCRDLAVYAIEQEKALADCSARIDMIREATSGD